MTGPLYRGIDTHALSGPARTTAIEVLAVNGVEVFCAREGEWTPTPVVSHAILTYNRGRNDALADGIVVTPSHNPPEDGGIKYNPPSGGPADTSATGWIEKRANEVLGTEVKRMPYAQAIRVSNVKTHDFVAVSFLFPNRPDWSAKAAVGKTLVSSSLIDRVAQKIGRPLREVPVGFKWFVDGLLDGSLGFGGEESAGASFLRKDGTAWTTDKDGILLDLLAAEILARTGKDPGLHARELMAELGTPHYTRIDAPATPQEKSVLKKLAPEQVAAKTLAGEPIRARLTKAPGNGAEIGGLKVVAENGWFAARPSGTEDVFKIYAESFRGEEHLARIVEEARAIVSAALQS